MEMMWKTGGREERGSLSRSLCLKSIESSQTNNIRIDTIGTIFRLTLNSNNFMLWGSEEILVVGSNIVFCAGTGSGGRNADISYR